MDHLQATLHHQRRGDCYRLLSACFYPPMEAVLSEKDLLAGLRNLLRPLAPEAAEQCALMEEAGKTADAVELAVEHAALFLGPNTLKAPPYGSVYLEEGRRLMGDTTMAVQDLYREFGLEITFHDAPDHIIFELEFMGYLCGRAAELANSASSAGELADLLGRQRDFLVRFLASWVPPFCRSMRTDPASPFYQGLANTLELFIAAEVRFLDSGAGNNAAVAA